MYRIKRFTKQSEEGGGSSDDGNSTFYCENKEKRVITKNGYFNRNIDNIVVHSERNVTNKSTKGETSPSVSKMREQSPRNSLPFKISSAKKKPFIGTVKILALDTPNIKLGRSKSNEMVEVEKIEPLGGILKSQTPKSRPILSFRNENTPHIKSTEKLKNSLHFNRNLLNLQNIEQPKQIHRSPKSKPTLILSSKENREPEKNSGRKPILKKSATFLYPDTQETATFSPRIMPKFASTRFNKKEVALANLSKQRLDKKPPSLLTFCMNSIKPCIQESIHAPAMVKGSSSLRIKDRQMSSEATNKVKERLMMEEEYTRAANRQGRRKLREMLEKHGKNIGFEGNSNRSTSGNMGEDSKEKMETEGYNGKIKDIMSKIEELYKDTKKEKRKIADILILKRVDELKARERIVEEQNESDIVEKLD